MFVDNLHTSVNHRLNQIIHTLRHVYNMDLPMDNAAQMQQLAEHHAQVQQQIQHEHAFNTYHQQPAYVQSSLVCEAVRLLKEIAPMRKVRSHKSSSKESHMTSRSRIMAEGAKPDFLDLDKDGDRKEPMTQAARQAKKATHSKVEEKWDAEMHTAEKDVGKWEGYTIAELKARKKKLMDKAERSAAEQKEVRQINFAIRAKQKDAWGKIKETAMDVAEGTAQDEADIERAKAEFLRKGGKVTVGQTRKARGSQPYMQGSYHRGRTGSAHADLPVRVSSVPKVKLREDETLDKAETLLAAKDLTDRLQKMAEDAAKMAVDDLMPLVDTMKGQFGLEPATAFNNVVKQNLQTVLDSIIAAKDQTDNAITALEGGGTPQTTSQDISQPLPPLSGTEPAAEPGAEPGTEPTAEPAAEPSADTDWDTEFAATPSSSGPSEEPLGRARKQMDEATDKKDMEAVKARAAAALLHGGRDPDTGRPVDKRAAEQILKLKEAARSPYAVGMAQAMKITGDTPPLKKSTITLAHKIARKVGKSMQENEIAQIRAHTAQLREQFEQLQNQLHAHKQHHAQLMEQGAVQDTLHMGMGLEGEAILHHMRQVAQQIRENREHVQAITQQLEESLQVTSETQARIARLDRQLETTPYGVNALTVQGAHVRKFFETADHRQTWLEYNQSQLQEHECIDPKDLQRMRARLQSLI